ncbi:hypothetical protein N0V82_003849 [Gnomoniopsis sp. IMI 355080]|nr:hypothetical protein N0V82_003849 [Gnomoniopsis sp. IMI 355080]
MMSDPRRRRSPESSRRRRKSRRDSRERDQEQSIIDEPAASHRSIASNPREPTFSTNTGGLASSYYPSQPSQQSQHFASPPASLPVQGSPIVMRSSEPTPRAPSGIAIPTDLNRPRRVPRRHGSRSSLDSSSASSSSSSSYLDISRWYPSWGRGGGVLKTFFKTPSEHRPRRRRSQRKMHKKSSKKTKGVFVFGNNSSSSSVNSDMAYGMGFLKKPKSRGGGVSPNIAAAAASVSGRERTEGRPGIQRRQTDEEILEIGRKLQGVARLQTRADLDRRGQGSWESYQRHSSNGVEVSSRGLAPSKNDRRRHHASSSDDEWESASEGEDSDGLSALAYGHTPIPTPRPAKSASNRMSTASAIAAGSALVAGSAIAASTVSDRKSTVVDPKLFGPTNSLRDIVNTPCGFNDDDGAYNYPRPGPDVQGYAGSAESASVEARPLQRVFPLQTSDPGHVEAARASGSVVSSQQNYSSIVRDRVYSNTSVSNRPEPVPIQAPKPIAPVPSRIYNDERIRDASPEPTERHRKPTSDNKIYAETALVGAGVAALGAAILAGRDKGKGKEDDRELKHGKHEKYGHEDYRQDDTKVEDARKAQELRLMQEIELLEKALGKTNKAREQRRRDSKHDRDSGSFVDAPAGERRRTEAQVDDEWDSERERDRRRRDRQSKREGASDYDSRVSDPNERLALVEDDTQYRHVGDPIQPGSTTPIDVFQFQVPDDAFATGTTPPKAPSPVIIDVTPSPSPAPEQRRDSRRGSLVEETRNAHSIYEEAHHSTAPIPEAIMAAAIGAVAHSRRHEDEEEEARGRTNARTADTIQEEANKFYAARRVAEREIRSRSRSKSREDPPPRIVTPPEMQNRPPKNPFSGANADFKFDKEMSPTQLLGYWPEVAPVRDPSAERPRPVLNLVIPTPAPTPEPERQKKAAVAKEPDSVEEPNKETPSVVFGPRGEVIEVYEEPPTPSTSKRVSWGPSETKQYEEHSPERSRDSSPEKPRKGFGGWGAIAAAVTGAGVGAALASDREPKSPRREEQSRDEYSSGSRSPPKERPVLSKDMSSRVLTEEPEELPPAPGPKPASPRNSQQMPGAFSDDIDFAATLAAGLEHSGFDPEIVIQNPEYHRRDSPPGSNAPYTQPFAETVSDLGIYSVDDGYSSVSREPGYVIGEVDTPGNEKVAPLDDFEDVSRDKSKKDKRSSSLYDDIEVMEEYEEAEPDTSKLSKKERRKLEKAAKTAKMADDEKEVARSQAPEAGDDEWADPPTSKKSKKSKKAKRSSVAWDDADTPVNDSHVSVPGNALDDIKDAGSGDYVDEWDTPKKSKKSKRGSKGSDLPGDDPTDGEKRDHRRTEFYEPVDRDVTSVVSDSRYDEPSKRHSNGDDDRSVVSAPSDSKRDSKRSSGGFWGLLGGKEQQQQSKKDNADTLGAGVGLAGVATVAMAAAVAGSDAAGASPGQKQEEPHVERDTPKGVEVFEDPEIAPRVIKPAIDPQYGDLLPLPPSPSESSLEFYDEDALPTLPDSRPTTPPGQAPAVVRERESSIKRPAFASHNRRSSTVETPLRSPSHTAIPIQFRMGHRSVSATSPAIGSRSSPVVQSPPTPAQQESPPVSKRNEFSPTFRRQPPRPTSWDSSREIKPLYLLERSARPAGDEEHRNEVDMVPLPPSRQSPVPKDSLEYEQAAGLGVHDSPLMIDTDVALSADNGSQQPTPTGLQSGEVLPSFVQEAETTPLGFPSSSSLPESSYATPGEFPREVQTLSPPHSEPIATEASDVKEMDKLDKRSYFPSALSMIPAATMAGVGVLLGRGKKEKAHVAEDDLDNTGSAPYEPLSKSAEPPTETTMELPSETSEINQAELAESESKSAGKDALEQAIPGSPTSKAVDLQSPVEFQDAPTGFSATASQDVQPEVSETNSEAAVDTTDWVGAIGSIKKKKKGKKKQSVSNEPQLATFGNQDTPSLSNVEQDVSVLRDAELETVEKPPILAEPSMAPAATGHLGEDIVDESGMERGTLGQPAKSQPDVVDVTVDHEVETPRDLGASQQEPRNDVYSIFSEQPHGSADSPADAVGEEVLTQIPSQDEAASTAPAVEEPTSLQLETSGIMDEGPALPIDDEQAESSVVFTGPSTRETEPVEDSWAMPSSKKRNKKKKRQSIAFPDSMEENPTPTSSGEKTVEHVQESSLPHDPPNAVDLAEPPREQSQEPVEGFVEPQDLEAGHNENQVDSQQPGKEPADISSTGMQVVEHPPNVPAEEVPILSSDQTDESKSGVSRFLVEEPTASSSEQQEFQQEADPVPVPAEEEDSVISKKSRKNKKRKGSEAVDELTQSPGTAPPIDREQVELPIDLPEHLASTELPAASENAPIEVEATRSPSPADEAAKSGEAMEGQPLSVQQDFQPNEPLLESQEVHASPTLASHDSQPQPGVDPIDIEPVHTSRDPNLEVDSSKFLEPQVVVGEATQLSDVTAESALPFQEETPTKTSSPNLERGSFEPQDLPESAHEVEHIVHVESMPMTAPEKSDPEQEDDFQRSLIEEEATRREAETAQIQAEEAEVARLQLKRKPSKKDKSRLKDLKARAQQRAEEAEATASSSNMEKDLYEQPALEPEVIQTSKATENEPAEVLPVGEQVVPEQEDQISNICDSNRLNPPPETLQSAGQNIEKLPLAEDAQAETASEFRQIEEDPEELARREAEAEKIRDEESELARLKIKRKPSKKDKTRIKALQANVEEREREAEAAAQREAEEQAAVNQTTQDEAHRNLGKDVVTGLVEEVPGLPSGSEVLEDGSHHPVDNPNTSAPEFNDATDTGNMEQMQREMRDQGLPDDQVAQDPDEHPLASSGPSRISELLVGNDQESINQKHTVNLPSQDIDTSPSALDQNVGTSEGHVDDIVKDITERPPSSSNKPRSTFGGWGVIAAAVTGAGVGTVLGKDEQPETPTRQGPEGDHRAESNDGIKHLDSSARSIQDHSTQQEMQADTQPQAEATDTVSHQGVLRTDTVDPNPARVDDAASITESSERAKDITATLPDLAPDPIAATEVEPESEWSVPTKKSKKDKKKKRKGTMSGESGENSAFATPLEASEPQSVPEPAEAGNTTAPVSQEEELFSVADREVDSAQPLETLRDEQSGKGGDAPPNYSAEDRHPSNPDEANKDIQEAIQEAEGSGHPSAEGAIRLPTADEAESGFQGSEQSAPLGELMDLPSSLVRSVESTPPTKDFVHAVIHNEPDLADQDISEGIEHFEREPHQLTSSAERSAPATEATPHAAPQYHDAVSVTEMSREIPLEAEPNTPILDEPEQLQAEEITWMPAKKKDRKKKKTKRGSVAWSEAASGAQTPIGEDVPESSTLNISEETSKPAEPLTRDENLSEARDMQPQHDSWSPAVSSEKERQASKAFLEPQIVSQARSDDQPREAHDVEGRAENSTSTITAIQSPEYAHSDETLRQESGGVPGPDSAVGQEDENRPLANDNVDEPLSTLAAQPRALNLSSREPVSKPDLESKVEEGEDTVIVTGGNIPDTDVPLTGEAANSQLSLPTSPPPTMIEDPLSSEAVPQPNMDSQVKNIDDSLMTADAKVTDREVLVASEQSVDLSRSNEPVSKPDLDRTVDDGEDTLIVAGGKVAEEVSEPWAFEATHNSPKFTKPDLDTKIEDGGDTTIEKGGKTDEDLVLPSHVQNDSQDDSQLIEGPANEFLDVDRPTSRPQSPAPWGDDDYSTSSRHMDLVSDQPVPHSASPYPKGNDETIPAGQDDVLDVQQSDPRPEILLQSDDENNLAFVTPLEEAPVLATEADPSLDSTTHQDEEQPFEWMPTKRSKKDKKNKKKSSISQSLDLEPEPSTSASETPKFKEAGDQQSSAEPVEAPDVSTQASDKAVEPATEDFDDWTPKKLTKKEKRKAKKSSISTPERQVPAQNLEEPQPETIPGSPDRTPHQSAIFGDKQEEALSQTSPSHLGQPVEATEPIVVSGFNRPPDVGSFPTYLPDSPGRDVSFAKTVEPEEVEASVDRQTEPLSSFPGEAELAAVTAAAAVPVLTRKMSKKEKRRAKKAASSWEEDALETSQTQAPAVEDFQAPETLVAESPIEDQYLTREAARGVSPTKSLSDQEDSAKLETSNAVEAIPDDEWAAPLSRKKSKSKKNKGKQLSLDSESGSQMHTTEEPSLSASAEIEDLPRSADVTVEKVVSMSADDFSVPTSPPRPDAVDMSKVFSSAHLEAKSPANLGTDLQKVPSAVPSPDPWENEDYFKPKTAASSPTDPPEEPFDKFEVHPAFTRGLNTASEKRSRDERPLVGLGLIHRHSSIFQEDDGHTPKLLTMTSDNASVESLAIEETSQTAQESSSISSSAHPKRRFPLSPKLSPRPVPEDPPKSPIPEEIKLSQRGSVAMLAQRFGGKRKKVSKYVDKRAPVEEDLFDDAAMWEGAERKAVDGSRMDDDAGDFWAVEDASSEEKSEPDEHPGQGSTSPAHSMGTRQGDDNVSATHSSPGPDAGRFTPELPGKATREEEVPLEPLVESPILGSQTSHEVPSPEPQHAAHHSPPSPSSAETSQTTHRPANIADTWDLIGARHQKNNLPSTRSASPASDRRVDLEDSALPSNETTQDEALDNFIPALDFRRSVSRGLPPVQEEQLEEEDGLGKHTASLTVTTPDINRDSGFVTDSPNQAWTRRFDDAQQRDSGVHMRDSLVRSPGLHSSRGTSPDPSRVSRSSVEDEGARLDVKPKRSPLAKYEERLRENTPTLEAQEPPVTPEPQKPRSDGSRTHKYPNLGPEATAAAALAGGAALLPAQRASPSVSAAEGKRSVSDSFAGKPNSSTTSQPDTPPKQRRAVSNTRISRAKTPEPLNLQPDSPSLLRHSGTPPLRSRRTRSGDLRTLSQSSNRSRSDLGSGVAAGPSPVHGRRPTTPAAAANTPVPASSSSSSDLRKATTPAASHTSAANPVANEGRLRSKDMADVYDGFGEGRLGSPRSPTRPHSMRRRQSMQVLDLENRVEQLMAENRALAEAKAQAELLSNNRVTSSLADRDNEIESLKQSLDFMRKEIHRLTEVNEGLNSAISQSAVQHQDQYRVLETQHDAATGELENYRSQYGSHQQTMEEKDAEIRSLREQLDATKEQVRELQKQILATNPADSDFLRIRDVDYFDHRCQQLCSHVQQWVLRFSKFSDMRACRLTTELNDEKIIDRLDNAVLDGSNVDSYLNDRVRRRDVFMSVAMTMIWEFVFTRYLFGMDREQRQKLKALEKLLLEVGPPKAVRQWRAVTLTLLSKRDAFKDQREQDTEAVVQAVFQTLSMILPPPSNLEDQIQSQLRKVMREAVDLSIEMRTQRAEYMMLPPLQPEYDASGDLAEPHPFNAQLMSERSGDKSNDDDLQAEGAIVRLVLFPLVVKKGDDEGVGDDEVVVCPAQVIVKKPRSSSRRSMRAPSSDAGGVSLLRGHSPSTAPNRSNVSMAEAEYIEGGI